MAATTTNIEEVSLRILVDEKKNKVLFAEAGKDFVDVLLSFLTLPLGTIARLVGNDESNLNKVGVGSLSSLYESVAKLDEKQFWTATCKEMLLRPRNSMEAYCKDLKLNIDDTEKTKYFICADWDCSRNPSGGLLSTFKNQRCKCGKLMNRVINHHSGTAYSIIDDKGFVPDMASFIISDDLDVKPDNLQTSASLHVNLESEDFDALKLVAVNITQKEIVDLLKCSLFSKTPLTDTFLLKKQFFKNSPYSDVDIGDLDAANVGGQLIRIKVTLRKSNNTILFALGEEDFVDFVLSFLTFPLGGVENMLSGNSCLGSLDNLYKSVRDLDPNRFFRYPYLKDQVVKSQVAHQFKLHNQILPIDEVPTPNFSCYSESLSFTSPFTGYLTALQNYCQSDYYPQAVSAPLSYLDPRSSTDQTHSNCGRRGYVKRPTQYMVTDDLVITPCSSLSAISFLTKLRVPPSDLEEKIISIGKKEGLRLLRASLMSSSALTNGLGPFLKPVTVKKEKLPN